MQYSYITHLLRIYYCLVDLISCSANSFISLNQSLILVPFYSLGRMGAEWGKFSEVVQKEIQNQLEVRFREMAPQGIVIYNILYNYISSISLKNILH